MRSKGLVLLAAVCVVAILAMAIAPAGAGLAHAVLPPAVAVFDDAAFVRAPWSGFDLALPVQPLFAAVPARAPPLA